MGVPVLLVVEDNIRYYSAFLPVIYTELIKQSRRVIQEGVNIAHKLVRMQARPKILLSSNYEDASELVQQYRDYLFGVVSDVRERHLVRAKRPFDREPVQLLRAGPAFWRPEHDRRPPGTGRDAR